MGHSILLADVIRGKEKSGNGDKKQDRRQKEGLAAQAIVQRGEEKKLEDATQHLHRCQNGSDGGRIEAQSSHVYWRCKVDRNTVWEDMSRMVNDA